MRASRRGPPGNAGWLTPGHRHPLPEPAVLKYGIRAVLSPSSPVYVPPSANPDFLRFVTGFTRHSTMRAWKKAMGALVPVNDLSLESFDLLQAGGVQAETRDAKSFLAAYRTEQERTTLLEEIEHIHSAGQSIEFDVLTGDEARAIEPSLSAEIGAAIRLRDQRFIDPGAYVHALADSVRDRGGKILTGATVVDVVETGTGVDVVTAEGSRESFDSVVLATGAWLGKLARSSASARSCRPAGATASASRSTTCPTARSTSRPSASRARRSATGSAWPA